MEMRMRRHLLHVVNLALLALLPLACGGGIAATPTRDQGDPGDGPTDLVDHGLRVFDNLLFSGKPDLSSYGLEPLRILYAGTLWDLYGEHAGVSGAARDRLLEALPEEGHIRALMRQARTEGAPIVVFDIEHWPRDAAGLAKYRQVIQWARDETPGIALGYYGFPARDYWRAIADTATAGYRAWQAENDALKPLLDELDLFFPSLYTFYEDQEGWVEYARANLSEALRLSRGKPVYPYLWPQYHDSNAKLAGRFLPAPYWRLEMETVLDAGADGFVIWGGWQQDWDEQAPWWQATIAFLREQGL